MGGITRIHGSASAQVLHGGYQLRWFKIAATGLDSATKTASVYNNFELAVRAVETIATVVVLGTVGTGGFVVGVDAATFKGRGDNTGYAAVDSSAQDLDDAVTNATKNVNGNGAGGLTVSVTETTIGSATGLAFA